MYASALLQLSRALHRAQNLEQAMTSVRAAVAEYTRYNRAYVNLLSPDGSSFDIVGWVLPDDELVHQRLASIDVRNDRLLQRVFSAEEPFFIEDLREEPLADQAQVAFFGARTSIVIPMFDDDGQIGPLVIPTYADQGVIVPIEAEFDFFVQIGSLLAVVIGRLRVEDARRQLEEQVLANQRMQALGRLAGEISHDFNNLLLAMLGNAELALQDLGDHRATCFIVDIQQAATRAAGLTRQLLAFSRGQVLDKQNVNVNSLVHSSVQVLRRLLPQALQLRLHLGDTLGVIRADPGQIEQVLMNLLLNARDATDGKGRITVETQNVRVDQEYIANHNNVAPGSYVLISVTDDGSGIDQDTQRRIFEPFFTTKADKGTGLGLAVVQGIVEQHAGHINVYSELGAGTTFKVYLPVSEQLAHHVGTQLAPATASLHGTEHILLVDDEEHVRRTVERVLSRAGYSVHVADSVDRALALLSEHPIDLLLTDVVMPPADGTVLAAQARKQAPELRVLFMTGYARGRLDELGEAHINKPFAPLELLQELRRLLQATPSPA